MQRTQWNDDEDEALDGLPHVDQVLYLRGIRQRMDYSTGIAGIAPFTISYSWLSQLAEVRPRRGSTMKAPPRLTKQAMRSSFERMESAGLVQRMTDHQQRGLVFRCLLADTNQSDQMRNNPRTTPEQPQQNTPKKQFSSNDLAHRSNPIEKFAAPAKSHPIQESGIREEGGLNRPVESSREDCDETAPASLPVRHVFDYWRNATEHHQAKLGDKRRKAIASRLKEGYSTDELKRAIDGCLVSPWHQGQNGNKRKYDDIELICRDASKVDQFISLAGQQNEERRKLDDWLTADSVIEGECRHVR